MTDVHESDESRAQKLYEELNRPRTAEEKAMSAVVTVITVGSVAGGAAIGSATNGATGLCSIIALFCFATIFVGGCSEIGKAIGVQVAKAHQKL